MATKALSTTQVDKLGERLRKGATSDDDLRLLDEYRKEFAPASDVVLATIRAEAGLEATARPAKSTPAIIEKLQRETIRLSQIQDIAGCRIIVRDVGAQDQTVSRL